MKIKNRLNYWRHQLLIDTQTEFASLIGVSDYSLNRWEKQKEQPGLNNLLKIYLKLKELIPDLHLEDLIEIEKDFD